METFEEIKKCWEATKSHETKVNSLNEEFVEEVIRSRVKKERQIVMEYFWAAFVYQIMVYSFATHLIIKFWGDGPIMLMSLAGIVLYIPSTVVMMIKFRAISVSGIDNPNTSGQQVHTFVKNQYILLSEFFRFKKRFDWVGIPLSCFILVIAGFKIYIPGGVEEHIIGGLCSFVVLLIIFVTAILLENRKRFIRPLRQLEAVLEDLKST